MNRYASAPALAIIFVSFTLIAQEKKIQQSELPPAVLKTIQKHSRGATIKGYSTETEHGKKVYEAETIIDGRTRDIQVAADGTLNEIEEEVAINSLPAAVQTALTRKAAGAKITKVESLTKRGTLIAYEASLLKGARKSEIQVGPNGSSLAHQQ